MTANRLPHLGVGDTFVGQPGVQLIVGFDPKPRREETFPDQTDLVLDLTLLPTRGRRAGHRINQVMAAHLQEAAIICKPPGKAAWRRMAG